MDLKKIIPILAVVLVLGCIQAPAEETKLMESEGLGILLFGLPSNPENPVIEIEKVPANSDAFLSLILRNNAEGDIAKDITVSLDNVEPFDIVECGDQHSPVAQRTEACYGSIYDDRLEDDYRTHRINEMRPDEELEFFWVLKSPSKLITGGLYYQHPIYVSVNYHYHTSIYTGVAAMTFQEYSSRKSGGGSLTGTSTSSAGEVIVYSQTSEPILYVQGSPGSFVLKLLITNRGNGIPKPNEKVNLTIEFDKNLVELNGETTVDVANQNQLRWFNTEYGANKQDRESLLLQQIEPINLISNSYTINVPFKLLESNANYQILPFYVRISYDYSLESQTALGVIPT